MSCTGCWTFYSILDHRPWETRHANCLLHKIWNVNSVSCIFAQSVESWFCSSDVRSAENYWECRGSKGISFLIFMLLITNSAQYLSQMTKYCVLKFYFYTKPGGLQNEEQPIVWTLILNKGGIFEKLVPVRSGYQEDNLVLSNELIKVELPPWKI